jgi:hypothetical protein
MYLRPSNVDEMLAAEEARCAEEEGRLAEYIKKYRGDAAINTIEMIISKMTDDPDQREALRRQAATIRDRHAGPNPTDVELALAERIAVMYMDVCHADQTAYDDDEGGVPILHAEFYERRRDRANRRYLSALDALARVRKMTSGEIITRFRAVG